ncbi:MAG: histidine kinase [Bacteroidota bacterium]
MAASLIRFLFFLFCITLSAQELRPKNALPPIFVDSLEIKVLKSNETSHNFDKVFGQLNSFLPQDSIQERTFPRDTYWILLDFRDTPYFETFYITFNSFDYGSVYVNQNEAVTKLKIGQFDSGKITKKIRFSNYYSYIAIQRHQLLENRYLLLEVKRVAFRENPKYWNFTVSQKQPNTSISLENAKKQIPYILFSGFCLVMLISAITLFFLRKRLEFIYYAIYLAIIFAYLIGSHLEPFAYLFPDRYYIQHLFSQSFVFLSHIAYCLFLIKFLDTKKNFPAIVHQLIVATIFINILCMLLIFVFHYADYLIGQIYLVDVFFKTITISSIFAALYVLYLRPNKLIGFIIVATLAIGFAGLARIYLAEPEDGLYLDSLYYLLIGSFIEIVLFSVALNYKFYLELNENFRLKEEALENKIKALSAQINPHFIFNALGSIQHLILRKENTAAITYLTKFSRLARNTMESSVDGYATLDEEVKMLKDYLELESLRFDAVFSYDIDVNDDVNAAEIEIPFMITQPFVENAIIHGILPKEDGEKEVHIHFEEKEELLVCTIDDSGVGRMYKKDAQTKHGSNKKSRGIQVTKARLKTMAPSPGKLEIVDKTNETGEALGTKVILYLPLGLNAFSSN